MDITETPTIETHVGAIVAQRPSSSRVFERLGIDYCCGGQKRLLEVCAAKGLDAKSVLADILAADAGTSSNEVDWSSASLTELTDHIEQTHHAYLKQELPRLETMVRKVAAVHGDRYSWMLEVDGVYAGFVGEMQSHILKEEQMLFPLIRSLDSGTARSGRDDGPGVANVIRVMEHEHDDAGAALRRLRDLSHDYVPPADACNTFIAMLDGLRELEADTHLHVHKENNILFPCAEAAESVLRERLTSSLAKVPEKPSSHWFG